MFKINETFYSLQGEGFLSGTPAFFVRFSGCNLRCTFCDTEHRDGQLRSTESLVEEAAACPARLVVLTGGEPSLFATPELIAALHDIGKYVAMETNGTHPLPSGLDWVTCSPKDFTGSKARLIITACDELKVLYWGQEQVNEYPALEVAHRFLQPIDTGNAQETARIAAKAVDYCLAHPLWRLSLQTHKLLHIQ